MSTSSCRRDRILACLEASQKLAAHRAHFAPALVRTTGLSPEGVELGFTRHLESAIADLDGLLARTPTTTVVHVVLSANVFVAPLRALVLALAAAPRVVVCPSRREPVFVRALAQYGAPVEIAETLPAIDAIDEGELHVYGRDSTIAAVRLASRVPVRAHGSGMGVALVSPSADVDRAANALASDVVAFDQRGCLSPRLVFVERRWARPFAEAFHVALGAWEREVPRGELLADERVDVRRFIETLAFAGAVWEGTAHVVGLADQVLLGPPGRHMVVVAHDGDPTWLLSPLARAVVTVGADNLDYARRFAPSHARVALLGQMQCPPLDGPVDGRGAWSTTAML